MKESHVKSRMIPSAIPRDFLDSFAYLCDTEKGGKTVTATALQSLAESDFLWLAANEGVRNDVYSYAETILQALKTMSSETVDIVKSEIFSLAVKKCRPRNQFYRDKVQKLATNCRMELRKSTDDDLVKSLRRTLRALSEPKPSVSEEAYIDSCYDLRTTAHDDLKKFSKAAKDDFAELAHYIWRLGATRSNVNKLVEAMINVPSLRRISEIRKVDAPSVKTSTIDRNYTNPLEVLYDIFAVSQTVNPLHHDNAITRLFHLDPPVDRPIKAKMEEQRDVITRVHAELQIADIFSRYRDVAFVANDKYIGCSKPACYFCYLWLCNHKHNYVPPATHYKIIPGCRGPDHELNGSGATVLSEMYGKISREIGQDIIGFLQGDAEQRLQYMSTEASTRAPSRL